MNREHIFVCRGTDVHGGAILKPTTAHDNAALEEKIRCGETVAIKVTRVRSLEHHRLFFGLLDHVARASEFETPERLLVALKLRLGRFDLMKMPSGKAVPVPQSISFAKMDQGEFNKFFDESVRVICSELLPGLDQEKLIDEVQAILGNPPLRDPATPPDSPQASSLDAPMSTMAAPGGATLSKEMKFRAGPGRPASREESTDDRQTKDY